MIILQYVGIKNYRNIRNVELEKLRDLNILIGPNNCGKTNFLDFVSRIDKLECGGAYECLCKQCQTFKVNIQDVDVAGVNLSLNAEDFYLNDYSKEMTVAFLLDEGQINKLVPGVLEKQREKLKLKQNDVGPCGFIKDKIVMGNKKGNTYLYGKHLSPFIHEGIIQEIKNSILYCPEGRLQSYKENGFVEYVRKLQLRTAQKKRWIDFLQRVVDPRINDERYENLIRKVNGEDFETEISKQGSGVRSLVCLAVDILFSRDKRIVLIDEPELGLNPFAKQEFLKFLLDESKEKQIFIATQDPTFVNPVLWKNNNVSVYFYSVINEGFLKIDLNQNKEDPNTFAGYLPHTVSLKNTHIYVEGTSDVYIFQIFVEKYLKENFKNWFEIVNEVGIYHLCGGFWSHLLYTIPKHPYRCIVILDGDKRSEANKVCNKHNEAVVNVSKFKFCENTEDMKNFFGNEIHPIYCLKEDCIEKYLNPKFNCNSIPKSYNKKIDGPKKAEKMDKIPEEIEEIFKIIFRRCKNIKNN